MNKVWFPKHHIKNKRQDVVIRAFQILGMMVGSESLIEEAINKYAEYNKIDDVKPASFFDLEIPGDGAYASVGYDKDTKSLKIMFEDMPTTKQMIGDIILGEKI